MSCGHYFFFMKCTLSGGGLVAKWCPTLAIPWTVAGQAPLSLGFSRQEYWSGLPFPSPGDLPDPGIKPRSPAWQADSFPSELQGSPLGVLVLCNTSLQKLLLLISIFKYYISLNYCRLRVFLLSNLICLC